MEFHEETGLPFKLDGGSWKLEGGHLQGVAVDDERNFLYYSFTDRLVKVDMHTGEIVGSVTGLLSGSIYGGGAHLGDLDFYQGKVYGSLEYKATEKFYVAVFDGAKITEMDMDYRTPGIMTTMYMPEVVKDFRDELDAGEHENNPASQGHRYGCSGIDGITFGPMPGGPSDKTYLFLAYGIYGNVNRTDNDYQVILAFDPDSFQGEAFDQNHPHEIGPVYVKKLFVFTGNTTYGVQNLEYDRLTGDYWMVVYQGQKDCYLNYPVYVIDGTKAPENQMLSMGDSKAYKAAEAEVLSLKQVGTYHEMSGVWGIKERPDRADTGFISLGNDYFYVATSGKCEDGRQYGFVTLMKLDRNTYTFCPVS